MLDHIQNTETRTNQKFVDMKGDFTKALIKAIDLSAFRADVDLQVQGRIEGLESRFGQAYDTRINVLEMSMRDQKENVKSISEK